MLLYMNSEPHKIRWDLSKCSERVKELYESLPEKAKHRMRNYITERDSHISGDVEAMDTDDRPRSVKTVNLDNIVQAILDDSCSSFK